jgi:hypothetical protein
MLHYPDKKRTLHPWFKREKLLLELVSDIDIVHVMLVLQVDRIQVLWDHGHFHPDFKRSPGRKGTVCQGQDPPKH